MNNSPLPESIANRYRIESSIGEGGMGTVYKAHDPLLNITVAIKQMRQADSTEALIRFQNEAVALAKLNHPNIAKVLDFAYDNGVTYMVMEYLDGESYSSKLKRGKPTLLENISIFIEIAQGLVHAHKKGVLHRDLKPSNIMIVTDTTGDASITIAKIVDFGIAKLHGGDLRLTTTNAFVGSPLYMSPEQAQGRTVDSRSEIYSFGCLMFEALKGRVPLKGETYLETINMHIETPAPRLNTSSRDPEFPEELDNLIFRCLKKNPEERVQSAAQLEIELNEILEDVTAAEIERQEALERELEETGSKDDGISENQLSSISNKLLIGGTVGFLLVIVAISYYMYQSANKQTPAPSVRDRAEFDAPIPIKTVDESYAGGEVRYDPKTQVLEVSGISSEAEIQNVKDLSKPIRDLRLTSCEVQGSFLKNINSDALRNLVLNDTKIDDDGLKLITRFPNLTGLVSISNINLTAQGYGCLPSFKDFAFLQIDPADQLTDEDIKKMAHFTGLKVFILGKATQLSDKCVPTIVGFDKLHTIGLKNCSFTTDGMAQMISGRNLGMLTIEAAPFSDKMCKAMIPQKSIGVLSLKHIDGLNSQNFKDICSNLPALSILEIECKNVDRESLWSLQKLSNLEQLSLFHPKWSDKLTDEIGRLPNLKNLKVDESDMPLDQITKFASMKNLKKLELIHFDKRFQRPMEELKSSTNGRIKGLYSEERLGKHTAEFLGHR